MKDGKQPSLGSSYTPIALCNKLLKASSAAWTKLLDPILEDVDEGGDEQLQCVLKCKTCGRVFSPSNPADTYKTHSDPTARSHCTGLAAEQAERDTIRSLAIQQQPHAGRPAGPVFIHQAEADKPLLSQVLPLWRELLGHAKGWIAEQQQHAGRFSAPRLQHVQHVWDIFFARFRKHNQPAWTAASVADPAFFEMDDDATGQPRPPPVISLTASQRVDVIDTMTRLNREGEDIRDEVAAELDKLEFRGDQP